MDLDDLVVYKMSMEIGDKVWEVVNRWNYFSKDTIGKQVVRSSDSIAANISEGFGRFHYKDRIRFLYYSRGSLFETKTWMKKALKRELITKSEFDELNSSLKTLSVKLNNYITSIKKQI